MGDYSRDGTVVEYAVQSMMKGKSLASAARSTAKKFDGHQNLFIGAGDDISIDPKVLEEALWGRLVDFATAAVPKLKQGKEHYALLSTLSHFQQPSKMRAELKGRIITALGGDPFPNDDGS